MQDHRKLIVWQRAQEKCVELYRFSADFPPEERYGMTAQLRKAAVSVGSNIAEGSKRQIAIHGGSQSRTLERQRRDPICLEPLQEPQQLLRAII